jgi:peptidoglycan/LPS O-acetylase OafA/YrhL
MNRSDPAVEIPDHIPRLDVLRAVAILLVFGFHYVGTWAGASGLSAATAARATHSSLDSFVYKVSTLGLSGVPLFFVISGFCIHFSVLRRRQAFQAGDFYWRRFLRIYPAYFAALAVFSFLGAFKILNSLNLKMFLAHLFLVHNLFNHQILYSINAAFWSLAVECQFYLLYPLVLMMAHKWGLKACLLWTLPLCLFEQIFSSTWILGSCLAEAYVQRERFFRPRILWLVASLALFIVGRSFPFIFEFRFFLDALFCAVLLEIYLASRRPLNRFERLLVPIGLISYSIYLWHQPLIKPLWYFLHAHCSLPAIAGWEILFFLPVTMLILSPVFIASYWLGEKAAPRLIRRWMAARVAPENS